MHPPEFGKLAARHNLVEIAEACWGESDACKMKPQPISPTCGDGRRSGVGDRSEFGALTNACANCNSKNSQVGFYLDVVHAAKTKDEHL